MERGNHTDATVGSPSRTRLVKLLLAQVVAPVDQRVQHYLEPTEHYGCGSVLDGKSGGPLASSAWFLNWVNQGLITLAFPEMGYNPIAARRQLARTEWASEIT